MQNLQQVDRNNSQTEKITQQQLFQTHKNAVAVLLTKLKGTLFLVIGFLLSPLSWWNDLFFNLPIAYGFGYICSWISPNLLFPCAIVGYWLSNILGILLMQVGALNVFSGQPERSLKKELLTGLISSTVYTIIILALLQLKILANPELIFTNNNFQFSSFFPIR
jgi:Zn-dependent protease with chaperone function